MNFEDLKKEAAASAEDIINTATVAAKAAVTQHTDDLLGDLDSSGGGAQDDNAHTEHYFANEQKSNVDFGDIDPQAFVQRMSAGAKEAQEELDAKFAQAGSGVEEIVDDFLMFGNKQQDQVAKQAISSLTNDFMNAERGGPITFGAGDGNNKATPIETSAVVIEPKQDKPLAPAPAAAVAPLPEPVKTTAPLMPLADVPADIDEDDLLNFEKPAKPHYKVIDVDDYAPTAPGTSQFDSDDEDIAAVVTPKPAAIVDLKDSDTDSPSISYTPSPAKKLPINEHDNEKFISSEDLLSDFKDEQHTSAPTASAPAPATAAAAAAAAAVVVNEPKATFKIPTTDLDADVVSAPVAAVPKPAPISEQPKPAAVTAAKVEPVVKPTASVVTKPPKHVQAQPKIVSVEEIFYKYGLDAWFKPERLHPQVESLIYWRDIKKSGIVFGAGLVTLLAISCCSVISVFAYLSLLTLVGTIAFRIYKSVTSAVQKTNEGHPFKEYLDIDLTLSQEKIQNIAGVAVAHVNGFIAELRRLFLVEDYVDSIKFGVILWVFTYIGAWFNGMTLVILAFVSLFTLPKVYENNKQSIDTYLDLVRSKLTEISDKIKVAIPIGNKKPVAAAAVETDKDK